MVQKSKKSSTEHWISSTKVKKKKKIDLCISFVKSFNWVNYLVIGIDNLKQLKEIVKSVSQEKLNFKESSLVIDLMKKVANEKKILLPYLWN